MEGLKGLANSEVEQCLDLLLRPYTRSDQQKLGAIEIQDFL